MAVLHKRLLPLLSLVCATPMLVGNLGLRTGFDGRVLAAHNRERDLVAVPPLQWDPALAAGARKWAEHLSRTGKFEHSPDPAGQAPEGENLWGGTPAHFHPEQMVGMWIAEKRHFRPGTFPNVSRSGRLEDVTHYSQLIWRQTTHVGCGVANGGKEEVLVCRYRTAGNVLGQVVL